MGPVCLYDDRASSLVELFVQPSLLIRKYARGKRPGEAVPSLNRLNTPILTSTMLRCGVKMTCYFPAVVRSGSVHVHDHSQRWPPPVWISSEMKDECLVPQSLSDLLGTESHPGTVD